MICVYKYFISISLHKKIKGGIKTQDLKTAVMNCL